MWQAPRGARSVAYATDRVATPALVEWRGPTSGVVCVWRELQRKQALMPARGEWEVLVLGVMSHRGVAPRQVGCVQPIPATGGNKQTIPSYHVHGCLTKGCVG